MRKQTIISLVSLALSMAFASPVFSQTVYLTQIEVLNHKVEKTGDRKVHIDMDLDLEDLKMKGQHVMKLIPFIVSADGQQEQALPYVVVEGSIRHKVNSRVETLEDVELYPDALAVVRRSNRKQQVVNYETTLPFKQWMIGGEIVLRAEITGCAGCEEQETSKAGSILPPMNPPYIMPFITPQEEIVKRRSETRAARLQFRQDSYKILPNYKNNREELAKVRESLTLVKENKDLSITGIYVTGYASPEGTEEYNMLLSERRAKAFTEYVKNDIKDIDPSLYHVDWKGEDWVELRRQVEMHPMLLRINDVLAIIDNCGDDKDACEELFKTTLEPEIYQRLLNEMYGPIRRNEYRIEYNVRHFDIEESRNMIRTRPDLMSVSEIHKVAESYGKGTPQYTECLLSGALAHNSNVTAVNNAALALMEEDRIDEAISLLENAPEDGVLKNVLGVAYFKSGDIDKSRAAFRSAAEMGNADAAENCRLMEAYVEYMAE